MTKKKEKNFSVQPSYPTIPTDLSYADVNFFTKRGFLAIQLNRYLNLPKENIYRLFGMSFSKTSFMDSNEREGGIVYETAI
jgi:hypothetical protein